MNLYIAFILLIGLLNITLAQAMDDFSLESQALFKAIEKIEGDDFFQTKHSLSPTYSSPPTRKQLVGLSTKTKISWKKNKIACPHCPKKYSNRSHCNRHIQTAHIQTRFWCDREGCEKSFPREDTLQEHKSQVHDSKEERYLCIIGACLGKRNFGCKSTLVKHIRREHLFSMTPGTPEYIQYTQCTSRTH